jgi:hypothetical protein
MAQLPEITLQDVVETLERHKRSLGRRYNDAMRRDDINASIDLMHDYNRTENQIRFMCDNYGCTRTTKPYKLGLNAPVTLGLAPVE